MKVRRLKIDYSTIKPHWAPNIEFAQHENASGLTPEHVEPYLIKVMNQAKAQLPPELTRLHQDIAIFIKQESMNRDEADYGIASAGVSSAGVTKAAAVSTAR